MTALGASATEHAVAQLGGAEMAQDVAARGFDVEGLAREDVEVRDAIVGERVTARVTLREEHDARYGDRAFERVLRKVRRADRRETETERQVDKRFSNAVL